MPHFDDRFRIKSYGSLFFIDDMFQYSGFLVEKFDIGKFLLIFPTRAEAEQKSHNSGTLDSLLSFENRYQMALLYEFPATIESL